MQIKNFILRYFAAILAAVMLLFAGRTSGGGWTARKPDDCKLTFSVLSDVHVEGNNFERYKIFAHALQDVKRNAANDAVVFLGDNTMNGQHIENLLFHGAVSAVLGKDATVLPVMGNHDIGNGEGDYETLQNRWYSYTEAFFGRKLQHPYYYEVIDGCYFIVLGMEAQLVYEMTVSEEQFTWLEGVLAEAAESGKPCFVFSHYPMDDAIDENGFGTYRLVNMLAEYNRTHDLFCFVGHTHMPMHLWWSFKTYNGYPEIYLPRITELAGDDDEPYADTGVGVQVEVYQNEVVVRARDFYRGQWKIDQWEDDLPLMERAYALKNPIGE